MTHSASRATFTFIQASSSSIQSTIKVTDTAGMLLDALTPSGLQRS